MITVSEIYVYPIKSCRGLSLQEGFVGRRGLVHDREYMVVDENKMFVSQRGGKTHKGIRSMCLISPSFYGEEVRVTAPDMPPLYFHREAMTGGDVIAQVWDAVCVCEEVSDEVSAWFTQYLGRELPGEYRLVRMRDNFKRHASEGRAELGFADGFPFLIVSQESLDNLNGKITGDPVPMNRFRPNVVINDVDAPHAEDHMDRIKINGIEFTGHWLCDRCPIPGIDQDTARKDGRPLVALRTYRQMKPGSDKVQLGRNFAHCGIGSFRVGSEVEILAQ